MKIFAISDLHLSVNNPKPMDIFGPVWENQLESISADWREKVGEDDIVLLAGDFSWAMKLEDAVPDFEMMQNYPGKKIIIRGNHDFWWKSISAVRKILPKGFYAIQNDAMKFGDVIVCGTRMWPSKEEKKNYSDDDRKIYARELLRLRMTLENAKKLQTEGEKIVCMVHYPPYSPEEEDSEVTAIMEEFGVSAVVYGHIHAYCRQHLYLEKNGIKYYLTSCDLVHNKLTEINV